MPVSGVVVALTGLVEDIARAVGSEILPFCDHLGMACASMFALHRVPPREALLLADGPDRCRRSTC